MDLNCQMLVGGRRDFDVVFGYDFPERRRVPVPVGTPCRWCEEDFVSTDCGMIVHRRDRPVALHRECAVCMLFGTVEHQMRRCPCFGGEDDAPKLSRREAAVAADLFAQRRTEEYLARVLGVHMPVRASA